MFGKGITLFKLFGFEVKVDLSWLIIALLISWTLAEGVFPQQFEGYSARTYWLMGILGALGLFLSIVIHEMSHSMVARQFGLPIEGITLFVFGGVAHMHDEPENPKVEFWMAVAGPIASIVLGVVFFGIRYVGMRGGWPDPLVGVINYLGIINLVLAAFNLVPAFPLDGGRVLRSALWKWKKDLNRATKIASRIGSIFGAVLIALGVLQLIAGAIIAGIWWILIGMFLRSASLNSYRQRLVKDIFAGEDVRHFMKENPVTVNPDLSMDKFVNSYVYEHHHDLYPVTRDSNVQGCVTTKDIKKVPRDEWSDHQVQEVMHECNEDNTIQADDDANHALNLMKQNRNSRLMVLDNDRLVGILTLKDMLSYLSLKLDLEEDQLAQQAKS